MSHKPAPTQPVVAKPLRYFEVSEYGTITDPAAPEPKCNRDVFAEVSTQHLRSIEDLISEIENCYPLARHYAELANTYAEEIAYELEALSHRSPRKRKGLKLVELMRGDSAVDEGWRAWLQSAAPGQLADFMAPIEIWLDEGIEWRFSDWFDSGWNPQDAAMNFFRSEVQGVLEALDVVFVEGEHPGSTYYAAELQQDLAEANAVAARLNLDYRFRAANS